MTTKFIVKKHTHECKKIINDKGEVISYEMDYFPVMEFDILYYDSSLKIIKSRDDVRVETPYSNKRFMNIIARVGGGKIILSNFSKIENLESIFNLITSYSENFQIHNIRELIINYCTNNQSQLLNSNILPFCEKLCNFIYDKWLIRRLYLLGFSKKQIETMNVGLNEMYDLLINNKLNFYAFTFCQKEYTSIENIKNLEFLNSLRKRLNLPEYVTPILFYDLLSAIQSKCLKNNSTFLEYNEYRKIVDLYKDDFAKIIGKSITDEDIDKELFFKYGVTIEDEKIYTFHMKNIEKVCINFICSLIRKKPLFLINNLSTFVHNNLKDEIKSVLINSFQNRISLLSCGDIESKKIFLNSLFEIIKNSKKSHKVQIITPTGKSLNSLKEILSKYIDDDFLLELSTIDLLMIDRSNKKFNFLIVYESSMIDIYHFSKFFRKYNHDYHMLLIGDQFSLPPVGIGSLFLSLSKSEKIVKSNLNFSDHFKSLKNNILNIQKCQKITNGENFSIIKTSGVLKEDFSQILKHFDLLIKKYGEDNVKILSFCNKSLKLINEKLISYTFSKENPGLGGFVEGNKVFINNNFFTKEYKLINGDRGEVISVNDNEIMVKIGENDILFGNDHIPYQILSHDYAFTIHKSQGSSYDAIILYLEDVSFFLSMNHIYTALLSAKKEIIILGSLVVIDKCIEKGFIENRENISLSIENNMKNSIL